MGLTAFILVLFLGLFSTLFGFPGTVVILISTVIYGCVTGFQTIGPKVLLSLVLLSVAAESLEFYLGMRGAKQFGFTKQGLIAAAIGGILGAILMTPMLKGLGTLIGALLGSFIGILIIEIVRENNLKPSARASLKALLGGMTGMLTKGIVALTMVIIVLSAIYS